MVKKFGDEKAAWALGITGLVIAMPVFFDAGLIILIPLAFSLAKKTKRSSLHYVIPLLAGLAVGHAFIPPTPGTGSRSNHVKCRSWLGHLSRNLLRNLRDDHSRSGLGIHLW